MSTVVTSPGCRCDALAELDAVVCSDGAPSARNLIVTAFGDMVLAAGAETETTVQGLTSLLSEFAVNERLVRTSLSRLVQDGLLAVRSEGRRSYYRVAPEALELFGRADERIYRGRPKPWDGAWTLVVLDGAESTAEHRAALRQELATLGLGVVAPNVLGSPLVPAETVAETVARMGGVEHVVVTRAPLVGGDGLVEPSELARRCLGLDGLDAAYAALADRLAAFDDAALARLDDARAAKLRLLVVSTFRRIVLADPMLPEALLPDGWAGARARMAASRCYEATVTASDRWVAERLGIVLATDRHRFAAH